MGYGRVTQTAEGHRMELETNLDRIRSRAEELEEENWSFRTYLKSRDEEEIDGIVHRLYEEVADAVDCTQCANCCKELPPGLEGEDIEGLAAATGMDVAAFEEKYVVRDELDGERVFKWRPCVFLEEGRCSVYGHRPESCASYPHLHKDGFVFRVAAAVGNSSICPIVFNVYEELKREVDGRRR